MFLSSGTIPLTGGNLNGHNTVIFNGTDQFGNTATPVIAVPWTMYIVMRQITHTAGDYFFEDGVTAGLNGNISQSNPSPRIIVQGSTPIVTSTFLLNTWNVLTLQTRGALGSLRIGLNNALQANMNIPGRNGINLASTLTPSNYGNIEVAYIIMRDVADSTLTQNNIINWLKQRFAI